ncbi:metallophosphoesterase family protein [Arthrobacter sp. MDB2-24]
MAATVAALLAVSVGGCVFPPGDVRIAAVGDMNGARTDDPDSPSGRNGAAITRLVENDEIDAFLGLGDFQYDTAYCADYVDYWKRLWGGTMPKLYWVSAPNHDWQPGRNEDLDNFMNGQCPGSTAKAAINEQRGFIGNGKPYSKDFGNWHFAFLSSAHWEYDSSKARESTEWLDNDLAAARAAGKHLAVVYHEPYFTSNTDQHERAADHKPWIDVMWKHRVRLTLSGSQHNYERSCPVDNADRCVSDGMTAFQVSTGGINLRSFTSRPSYIEERFSDTHGYLRLTLRGDGSFDWEFVPTSGSSTDSGTRSAP